MVGLLWDSVGYGEPSQSLTHDKHLSNVNYYLNLPYDIYWIVPCIFCYTNIRCNSSSRLNTC